MLGALSREKALPLYPVKVEEGSVWVGFTESDEAEASS
jgi:hypothetical protein